MTTSQPLECNELEVSSGLCPVNASGAQTRLWRSTGRAAGSRVGICNFAKLNEAYLHFFAIFVGLFRSPLLLPVLLVQPSVACSDVQVDNGEDDADSSQKQCDDGRRQGASSKHCRASAVATYNGSVCCMQSTCGYAMTHLCVMVM